MIHNIIFEFLHLNPEPVETCIKSPIYANTANKGDFMHIKEKFNIKKTSIEIAGTIVGAFIIAIGVSLFLLPNQLSSGGISGIATITYYLLNIPMGIMILLINIPLFILSIYKIGKSFFMKSIIGTVALSVFIDILDRLEPLTNDRFLACIYGGIIIGLRNSNSFKGKFIYRRN